VSLWFLAILLAQTLPWNDAHFPAPVSDWEKYEAARHNAVAEHKHLVVYVGMDAPINAQKLEATCEVVQVKTFTAWPTEKPPCILVSRWDETSSWHWWLATLPGQSGAAAILTLLNPPPVTPAPPLRSC
jgi:hypothetical protein